METLPQISSLVYFVGAADGPIKIGRAVDVAKRVATLQIGSPYKLIVHGVMCGGGELEVKLHVKFGAHRLSGEWFSRCPEIEEFIAENAMPGHTVEAALSPTPRPRFSDATVRLHDPIVRGLSKVLVEQVEEVWEAQFEALRNTMLAIDHVNKMISKDGIIWAGHNELKKDIRNAAKDLMGVRWMQADDVLWQVETTSEEYRRMIRSHAVDWFNQNQWKFIKSKVG